MFHNRAASMRAAPADSEPRAVRIAARRRDDAARPWGPGWPPEPVAARRRPSPNDAPTAWVPSLLGFFPGRTERIARIGNPVRDLRARPRREASQACCDVAISIVTHAHGAAGPLHQRSGIKA